MTTTNTPTSGAADLPEALRSIQRFEVVDCIDDKHVPAVIPKPHGPWVRYEDHIAALAAGQATAAPAQPAAQQGAAYAALPTHSHAGRVYEEGFLIGTRPLYTADKMRAFADATHTLRATHGQAPAKTGNSVSAQADSVLEDAARLDFLVAHRAYVVSDEDCCDGYWLHYVKPDGATWVQMSDHATPRAAIDAAMNKGGA